MLRQAFSPPRFVPESLCEEFAALVALRQWPDAELIEALAESSDIAPAQVCEDLEIPRGSTYARAVRQLCES